MKWPHAAGKSRQGIAESLATVTPALFAEARSRPSAATVRQVLYGWSFNARARVAGPPADRLVRAERWIRRNTRPVRELTDPAVFRPALDALTLRMDGQPAAASTVSRKRAIFFNSLEYAVELGHLPTNPITAIKWRAPKLTEAVNPRVVINHGRLGHCSTRVGRLRPGPALVAFFGVMYYAALRPSEAVDLRKEALTLPRMGWGELYLSTSAPAAGRAWSEGGTRREPRQLKHRGVDEVRIVPCPPELTDAAAHAPVRARHHPGRPAVPRRPRRPARGERLRARLGLEPGPPRSPGRSTPHRSHAGPTTCGTLPSRPGSTEACRLRRWRSGPGTASTSCCGSTPSASPARRTPCAAGSRRPCAPDGTKIASVHGP